MESFALGAAAIAYGLAGCIAAAAAIFGKRPTRAVAAVLAFGLAAHALSLGLRWERVGHGPFIAMFEVLSSNAWSLTLAFFVAYLVVPAVRPAAAAVLPVVFLLMAWTLSTFPDDGHLPASYATLWLYAHVAFGKVFLGALLVATGVSALLLWRDARPVFAGGADAGGGGTGGSPIGGDPGLELLAMRFVALSFVFESLMLVTGAIWAQGAWGRYWDWDPLETWAFVTWLAIAALLHARLTLRLAPRQTALLVIAVFAIAFLTFFGIPFVSTALHKGAV
jgi:ABC-type transport system involved in cytochrome c biogenesis permease subunit